MRKETNRGASLAVGDTWRIQTGKSGTSSAALQIDHNLSHYQVSTDKTTHYFMGYNKQVRWQIANEQIKYNIRANVDQKVKKLVKY
jgi:hypothetical protein